MLSSYKFQRKAVLLGTVLFASVVVALMPQSAHAQTIATIRGAVISDGMGHKVFSIDTTGRMGVSGNVVLEFSTLNDDGSFVGRYYPAGKSFRASTNVTGSITITRGIRISFTVREPAGVGV